MNALPRLLIPSLVALGTAACAPEPEAPAPDETPGEELSIGELDDLGVKSDGWGAALNCKPIPNVPALADPEIVISLDGLTLHLRDKAGTYDRVFPVGPGAIGPDGKSYTPVSTGTTGATFYTSNDTREVPDTGWGWYYPCRIWWTDSETKEKRPVFAGLPFIRLVGPPTSAYAIHGPVDGFSMPSGGKLRRGFVSHGCTRMAAEDIVEVYARIKGKGRVPVRIQKEVERDALGRAVDVPKKWIGQECATDGDCNYDGGLCVANPYGRSYCSRACTGSCPDRAGYGTTRCIKGPRNTGLCAIASDKFNNSCGAFDGRVAKSAALFGRSGAATVCLPGTKGGRFAPCLYASDCTGAGAVCQPGGVAAGPGFCTTACSGTCAGNDTVCSAVNGANRCVEKCWSQDVCALGTACEDGVAKASGGTATACVP